ncbi:MAG: CAP domain-containing protein, partial [Cardiobacteriaceae bacterium]|nr:CAP domain-containing protein [Cardiobacteriaceae bacterium]
MRFTPPPPPPYFNVKQKSANRHTSSPKISQSQSNNLSRGNSQMTNQYNRKLPLSSIISKTIFTASAISAGICSTNALADTFTVSSNTNFTNTDTGKNLTYKDNFFRPGNHSEYEGSAGFFDSQGATEAVNLLEGTSNKPSWYDKAKPNYDNDATSLDNMQASFSILKRANELRAEEGKSPLKVSHEAMAISQLRTNYANNTGQWHAPWSSELNSVSYTGAGENLADVNNGTQAVNNWYSEKVCITAPSSDDCKRVIQMNLAATKPDDAHGHYDNLVNDNFNLTGAAISENYSGQMYFISGDESYTVEEYEKLFDEYMATDGWLYYNADNTVNVSNDLGTDSRVAGGYALAGKDATSNTVNINSNANVGTVYGGYAVSNNTSGNTVNLSGGQVGTIYGGYAENNSGSHNNTINITGGSADAIYLGNGATVSGTVNYLGGTVTELKALQGKGTAKNAVMNFGATGQDENLSRSPMNKLKVGKLGGYNTYNFYLPANIKNDDTAVQVTGDEVVNLSGASVNAYIHSDTNLNAG